MTSCSKKTVPYINATLSVVLSNKSAINTRNYYTYHHLKYVFLPGFLPVSRVNCRRTVALLVTFTDETRICRLLVLPSENIGYRSGDVAAAQVDCSPPTSSKSAENYKFKDYRHIDNQLVPLQDGNELIMLQDAR